MTLSTEFEHSLKASNKKILLDLHDFIESNLDNKDLLTSPWSTKYHHIFKETECCRHKFCNNKKTDIIFFQLLP